MKIVIATDSFKGSLSSREAGEAIREGVLRAVPTAMTEVVPIADGGEGTVEALTDAMGGRPVTVTVSDPLERPVNATYGLVEKNGTAIIEMSAAAGLPLLSSAERDPRYTTTRGVGELILDAMNRGARRFVIGIGGSATNDGGAGMLQALGFSLTDADGNPIAPGNAGLATLAMVKPTAMTEQLAGCRFLIACDVDNPLCGVRGCSAIFAPQKGARPEDLAPMDAVLAHFAKLSKPQFPKADPTLPGAGAAGGLGFALAGFLNATLVRGIDLVLEELAFEKILEGADLVITGEGRLDAQSLMGKTPIGVARAAKRHGIPTVALAGSLSEPRGCLDAGIDAYFSILSGISTLEEAMRPSVAAQNLSNTAEQVVRLFLLQR